MRTPNSPAFSLLRRLPRSPTRAGDILYEILIGRMVSCRHRSQPAARCVQRGGSAETPFRRTPDILQRRHSRMSTKALLLESLTFGCFAIACFRQLPAFAA